MSQKGENHYRELADNTSGLIDYFYEATPVQELGQLNIGSRPSHRNTADRSKQSIRAIPWVFGWSLSRHTLPAWYGLGSAIEKILNDDKENLKLLQNMYKKKVIICLHPQNDISIKNKDFENFECVKYKTEEFISKAFMVLYHEGSSVLQAIIQKKEMT